MHNLRRRSPCGHKIVIASMVAISCSATGHEPLLAQQMQTRLPAFQAPARGDLETEILDRLSLTGQYRPDDLPRLARLTVLESIASLSNVRADLLDSGIGDRLETQITAFWDASQNFYEIVSSAPLNAASLNNAQSAFVEMAAAERGVESTWGGVPGVSSRAADHFQAASRLMSAMSPILGELESNLRADSGIDADRSLNVDGMREQAQLVANELVGLIGELKESKPDVKQSNAAVVLELNEMLVLVQDFTRSLGRDLSVSELEESFRAARRRMWFAEASVMHVSWPLGLERRWRAARARMNGISDEFGLPRVIAPTLNVPAANAAQAASNRSLVAHLDHAVAWLDEVLGGATAEMRRTPAGSRFVQQTTQMRAQLLKLRRRALANEPAEKLLKSLNEIEQLNKELSDRASELRVENRPDLAAEYTRPASAVAKLRGLVPKS
jgi:hypothetical protein